MKNRFRLAALGAAVVTSVIAAPKAQAVTPNGGFQDIAVLMPFGGQYGTKLIPPISLSSGQEPSAGSQLVVTTEATSLEEVFVQQVSPGSRFAQLVMNSYSGWNLCFTYEGTGGTPVLLEPCTANNTNQQWYVQGGQITWAGQANVCLDISGANTATNGTAYLDAALCNGTQAQSFWVSGVTQGAMSTMGDGANAAFGYAECLDVSNNDEAAGATLDDGSCNATDAQWWIFTESNQVQLANDPSLCLQLTPGFSIFGGPALDTVSLAACSGSANQRWALSNQSVNNGGGCSAGPVKICDYSETVRSHLVSLSSPVNCLSMSQGLSAPGTQLDAFGLCASTDLADYHTESTSSASLWVPFLWFNEPGPILTPP